MVVKSSRLAVPRAVPASLPNLELPVGQNTTPLQDATGCFTREMRLLKADEFKRVFAGACKAGNTQLTILAMPNGLGYPRLGMAISRKAIRFAVQRNRIKRLLREYFRLNRHAMESMDLVIMAKPAAASMDKQALLSSIRHAFKQLDKRCGQGDSAIPKAATDTSPNFS